MSVLQFPFTAPGDQKDLTPAQGSFLEALRAKWNALVTPVYTVVAASVAAAGSFTPDLSQATGFELTCAGNVTVNNPPKIPQLGGQFLSVEIFNNTAGAITLAFGTQYKLAGAAVAPGAGKRRTYLFRVKSDRVSLIELCRAAADI